MSYLKAIRLFGVSVLTAAVLGIANANIEAKAQRRGAPSRYPLLENSVHRYFTSGKKSRYQCCGYAFDQTEREVISARQLYQSQFGVWASEDAYTVLVLEVDPDDFDGLTLRMITPDSAALNNQQTRVVLWQGGNEKIIYDLPPGSDKTYEFNIGYVEGANSGDISIEVQCGPASGGFCLVYFIESELSPVGEREEPDISSLSGRPERREPEEWRENMPGETASTSSTRKNSSLDNTIEDIGEAVEGVFDSIFGIFD